MEESGPEAIKRQRLDTFTANQSSHRILHQQHPESPLVPLHNNYQGPNVLRPPSGYHQPIPKSPYDAAHDGPPMTDNQPPSGYPHPHSGYNTPNRDIRTTMPEPGSAVPRHGSLPVPTRSPDEAQAQHMGNVQPLNQALDQERQHYQQPHGSEPIDPSSAGGYAVHEGPTNGVYMGPTPHGLPMPHHHHDPNHAPPHPMAGYGEGPAGHPQQQVLPYNPGPFSAGAGGAPWNMRGQLPPPQQQRKNTRATQVSTSRFPPSTLNAICAKILIGLRDLSRKKG